MVLARNSCPHEKRFMAPLIRRSKGVNSPGLPLFFLFFFFFFSFFHCTRQLAGDVRKKHACGGNLGMNVGDISREVHDDVTLGSLRAQRNISLYINVEGYFVSVPASI